jgi:hypothetical protein
MKAAAKNGKKPLNAYAKKSWFFDSDNDLQKAQDAISRLNKLKPGIIYYPVS